MTTLNKGLVYATHLNNGIPDDWNNLDPLTYSYNTYGTYSSAPDRFNNPDKAIQIANSGGFQVNNRLYPYNHCTISMWIKSSIVTGNSIFFGNYNTNLLPYLSIGFSTNNVWVVIQKGATRYIEAVTNKISIQPDTWYHITVVVKNKMGIDIYINGVKQSFSLSNTTITEEFIDFYIGTQYRNPNYGTYVNATIDELRVYDRPLTEFEVIGLYNNYDTEFDNTGYYLNNGLVYASHLNNGTSDDFSGNEYPTSIISSNLSISPLPFQDKNGNDNSSLVFDNTGGIRLDGDGVKLLDTTISLWLYKNNTNSGHEFFIGDDDSIVKVSILNGKSYIHVYSGGTFYVQINTTSTPIPNNTWVHYVISFNVGGVDVYTNKIKEHFSWSTIPNTTTFDSINFCLGGQSTGALVVVSTENFSGMIDEIRLYNRMLSDEEINMLYYGYDTELDFYNTLGHDLICGYHFSEDYTDFSGNENHLTPEVSNPVFVNDVNNEINKAIEINQNGLITSAITNQYKRLGFSMSLWYKIDTITTGYKYFANDNDSSKFQFGIFNQTKYYISIYTNGTLRTFTSSNAYTIADGNWHHLTYFYNSSITDKIQIYLDGMLLEKSTTGSGLVDSIGNIEIGYYTDNTNSLDSNLDEIRFYDRALTEYEITRLYFEYNNTDIGGGDEPNTPINKSNIINYL